MILHRIWDRRTTRHNWQIFTETDNKERLRSMIDFRIRTLVDDPRWEDAQIGIDTVERPDEGYMREREDCTQPRNAKMDMIISVKDCIQ